MLLQVSSPSRTLFSSTLEVFFKETMIWKKKTGVIQERKISRYQPLLESHWLWIRRGKKTANWKRNTHSQEEESGLAGRRAADLWEKRTRQEGWTADLFSIGIALEHTVVIALPMTNHITSWPTSSAVQDLQSCDGKLQSFERILYKLIVVVIKKGILVVEGNWFFTRNFKGTICVCSSSLSRLKKRLFRSFSIGRRKRPFCVIFFSWKTLNSLIVAKMEVTHHPLLLLQQHGWNLLVSRASNKILFSLKGCQTFCHCRTFC